MYKRQAEEVVALMTVMNITRDDFEKLKKWVIDSYREIAKEKAKVGGEH